MLEYEQSKRTSLSSEGCGPDYILNGAGYAELLDEKKAALRANKCPEELVALLDRDGPCVARVRQAPDVISMKIVDGNGSITIPWTPEEEEIARKNLLEGKAKAYYKFNVSRAFSCCGQPRYDERSDWDAALELNLNLTICCTIEDRKVICR